MTKEQRIMRVMHAVLVNVIKDATPQPGRPHPLSQETLDDIRQCLGLIALREKELSTGAQQYPEFKNTVSEVPLSTIKKN